MKNDRIIIPDYECPRIGLVDIHTESVLCFSGQNDNTYNEVDFNWGGEA